MSFNQFTKVMAKKNSDELRTVLSEKSKYEEQAILAAIIELKKRGESNDELNRQGGELAKKFKEDEEVQKFNDKFFSKRMIYGMAGFLSPLIIGPFMAYNIWNLGNRSGIWTVLLLAFIYLPLIIIVVDIMPSRLIGIIVPLAHLSYVAFFVEWTWKKYLPTYEEYTSKN